MRRAAGSKSCTQNLCCIKFFNEFYTRNLTWFYNSPAAVAVVVFLARQCLQFLNDFRLRTWHMERKAFAFAFAFEIEPFAALAVFIPCPFPCPSSLCRCWLSNHRSPGRPYRNVNQTGHSTGSGTVCQGGRGLCPVDFNWIQHCFWPLNACCNLYYRRLSLLSHCLRFLFFWLVNKEIKLPWGIFN